MAQLSTSQPCLTDRDGGGNALSRRGAGTHAAFAGLAIALFLIVPRPAHAAPGDIDPTFGRHGVTVLTFGREFAQGSAVAVDAQGRIIVAGTAGPSADAAPEIAVARLTSEGTLDSSFSGDGTVTVPLPAKSEVGGVAIDPSGRIDVGATTGGELFAVRLSSGGALDPGFSDDGVASLPTGGSASGGDLALDPNGSIVVGATGCLAADCHFAVARFTPDGVPDTSFSGDGVVTTEFPGGAVLRSVAVAADGRIVAAGSVGGDSALTRYLPNGDLDPAFGGQGRATVSAYTSGALDIVLDDAERITELGAAGSLVRLLDDATLDPTWPGIQFQLPREGGLGADGADGFFVGGRFGGCSRGCIPIDTSVAHVDSSGTIDPSFGSHGKIAVLDLGSQSDGASDVIADSEGRPVVVGFSGLRMMVARLTMSSGAPDADGDRVVDREDGCPGLFGKSSHHPGCPVVRPRLSLERRKAADLWIGTAASPNGRCATRQAVKIFRVRPGRDEFLSAADSASDGSFTADGNLRRGAYYAVVRRAFKPRIGYCRTSRSNEVVIHG
jgi:uncharacterized delta-60 repeat protein